MPRRSCRSNKFASMLAFPLAGKKGRDTQYLPIFMFFVCQQIPAKWKASAN